MDIIKEDVAILVDAALTAIEIGEIENAKAQSADRRLIQQVQQRSLLGEQGI